MKIRSTLSLVLLSIGSYSAVAQTTPTISGVNAFWNLGTVLHDGAGCGTTPPGSCYYAQATWTANSNGHAGVPTWTVTSTIGGGNVSLNCYTCTSTLATSLYPSGSCSYDLTVTTTYPDGTISTPFYVAIVSPTTTTLQSGYPTNAAWYPVVGQIGFLSTYAWQITDSCGAADPGLDANEVFGSYYVDYPGMTWTYPPAVPAFNSTSICYDSLGRAATNAANPIAETPNSPLSLIAVWHDTFWELSVGSKTGGLGAHVRSDTQQFWIDHGSHY